MHKTIFYSDEARNKLLTGINKITDAVKVTLGARGRTVIIRGQGQFPIATKDGVTVAKNTFLEDEVEATGALMVTQAADKTVNDAGDGTTATTILMREITANGIKAISNGANPVALANGIRKGTQYVVDELAASAIQIEPKSKELLEVATIACNNDPELGKLIASAFNALGKDAIVSIGESLGHETVVKINKGLRIPNGWNHPMFVNNKAKMTSELEKAHVLIYEGNVHNPNDLYKPGKILDALGKTGQPVLFICNGVDNNTMSSLLINNGKGLQRCCLIGLPSTGALQKDLLEDIAAVTGATICGFERGTKITDVKPEHCGGIARVVVSQDSTVFYAAENADTAKIDERVIVLREQLSNLNKSDEKSTHAIQIAMAQIQDRIAKLTGGVATIHVGGFSDMEISEKKDRVDDAIRATQSALQEGIVVGGGIGLLNIITDDSDLTGDELKGFKIVMQSIQAPAKQIAANCGVEFNTIFDKLLNIFGVDNLSRFVTTVKSKQYTSGNLNIGYNALTGNFEDLREAGILDAAKVVRCSIQHATEHALIVLLSECLMVEANPKK